MKVKILSLLGLAVAVAGSFILLNAPPAQAAGESYRWIDPNTIEASGGLYSDVSAANNGVIRLTRAGTGIYRVFSDGSCDITFTVTTAIDNIGGSLATEGCDGPAAGFDRNFFIANPQAGPPLSGAEVNYATVNCSEYYEGGLNTIRCNAVKSCITTAQRTKDECLAAWSTCLINQGGSTATQMNACAPLIAAGNFEAATTPPPPAEEEETSSCVIDGIGWIVCPAVNFLAQIVDAAYGFVSSLLVVQPLITTGGSESSQNIFTAWSLMRNFANVSFVIAFLLIIFSQLTSVGLNNYGIKKLLPRIIVAAVLVNVSFWVCAAAVDISNIIGASFGTLFDGLQARLAAPTDSLSDLQTASGWTGFAASILTGAIGLGIVLYVGLSALLPALIAALIAIVTVFLVLTLRQALIILLIIISPLAFVAYLLPNTESLFKKWKDLFQTLLLMYPIIALLFGASALASQVVMTSAAGDYKVAIQIMGALIAVIPLALTPIVMKTAGGLLNRFGGFVNNPNKGPADRLRKGAAGIRERQEGRRALRTFNGAGIKNGQSFALGKYQRKAKRDAVNAGIQGSVKNAQAGYIANAAMNNPKFNNSLAGGQNLPSRLPGASNFNASEEAIQRALANAINVKASIQAEEVKAANAIIQNANLSSSQQQELAMGQTVTDANGRELKGANTALRAAAIQNQMKSGTLEEAEQLITASGNINTGNAQSDAQLRQTIAEGVFAGGHNNKANYLGGDMSDRIKAGSIKSEQDLDDAAARRIEKGKLSAEALKGQDAAALKRIHTVAQNAASGIEYDLGSIGAPVQAKVKVANIAQLKQQAERVATDGQLSRQLTGQQTPHIEELRNL